MAGRVPPERLVAQVTAWYYQDAGSGMRAALQPVVDVIERGAPGVVELARSAGGQGFAIRAGERPFPRGEEPALRAAVEAVLKAGVPGESGGDGERLGVLAGLIGALRRLFG